MSEPDPLVESFPHPVFVTDAEGRISRANRAAAEACGCALAQLVGRPLSAVRPGGEDPARAASDEPADVSLPATVRRQSQELARLRAELQRGAQAVQDSEVLYTSLIESLPVHVIRKDREGRFTYVSRSFCELVGKPADQILGGTDFDLFPDALARKYRQDDEHVMTTGQVLETVEENRVDGHDRFVEVLKAPIRTAGGAIVGVQLIFFDVTAEKQAAESLRASEMRYRTLYNSSRDAIMVLEPGGAFIGGNPAAIALFGCRDEQHFISFGPGGLSPPRQPDGEASAAKAQRMMALAMEHGSHFFEWQHCRSDGVEFSSTVLLTRMELEGRLLLQATVRDVTEQKRAAEALRVAKELAEAASRAKSDFLARMSHEIRTPMNAIMGMTELVLDTPLTASNREYLEIVRNAADSLLGVINDILDFSKIEAGKLELQYAPFRLREGLGDTMKALAVRARGKTLELICHFHPDVPDHLVGDLGRLRQTVVNLVGNAIKFTAAGEVVVDVRCEAETDEHAALHFFVSDTGIGIPADKRDTIFEAFEQVDRFNTRRFGGTGLGLAICARLVAMMDGRIWVESEPGCGSRFHFTARFGRATPATGETPARIANGLRHARVLVVDDNATNRRLLEEWLGGWGLETVAVAGAAEALEQLGQQHAGGRPFGLVLTDMQMPVMDGLQLIERIRNTAAVANTPIMMLSSGDRPSDAARCELLGVATCLLKPLKQQELLDAMVRALGGGPASVESRPAATPRPVRPLRILLAEDSSVNQKLAVAVLKKQGHTVVVAQNGAEAVAAVAAEPFDLVLMDVQMPVMDGLEATCRIRAGEPLGGRRLPIIAMTAHALKGDREECLAAGMDGYVAKPLHAQELFDAINALVPPSSPPPG